MYNHKINTLFDQTWIGYGKNLIIKGLACGSDHAILILTFKKPSFYQPGYLFNN